MGPSRSLEPTVGDVREIWGPIRSAKTCKKRAKTHKKAQIQFEVLIGTQDSLARTPGAIFVRSRTTTVTGLYQLGYPRVAKQRCTIAQGPVSSSFFTNERFFSKRAGNLSSYLIFFVPKM